MSPGEASQAWSLIRLYLHEVLPDMSAPHMHAFGITPTVLRSTQVFPTSGLRSTSLWCDLSSNLTGQLLALALALVPLLKALE